MIKIPKEVLKNIEAHAKEDYPDECCGILGGTVKGGMYYVVGSSKAVNLNTERSHDRYVMNPKDIIQAQKKFEADGKDIVGYYHSHPKHEAYFSETDKAHAWPGYSYLVISVMDREVAEMTAWRFNEKTQQYERDEIEIEKGNSK